MSKATQFRKKPVPWSYSDLGALVFTAFMKLHPFHRSLSRLEIKNIQDYFKSGFVPQASRKSLNVIQAIWMCYVDAIKRVLSLSKKARQDYFAMNRHGCFHESSSETDTPTEVDQKKTPLLIVPGLNTPPAFFREMAQYFKGKGYFVSVFSLPEKGFADIESSSKALESEINQMKSQSEAGEVNVIGHCLGGLIGHQYLANRQKESEQSSIRNLITLGTGFSGAEGVQVLKDIWMKNHPGITAPKVFDELIQWNLNVLHQVGEVSYHNFITIWDFIVHFQKGLLENHPLQEVTNHIIDDPDIDHLTMVLNPKVFQKIETVLTVSP